MAHQFSKTIRLSGDSGIIPATLHGVTTYPTPNNRVCGLVLICERADLHREGPDYFEAFCRIREKLQNWSLRPLCYGASRDRFPSGMARDMGLGLKVYKIRMRAPTAPTDLVPTFDEGPDIEPVSVAEQREFFDSWLASRGIHRSSSK